MKFRLTYDGELKAAGNNNNRREEKWAIRRAIAPQLAELRKTHPALRGTEMHTEKPLVMHPRGEQKVRIRTRDGSIPPPEICWPKVVGTRRFVPLVRSELHLVCTLDILFMRKDEPGDLVLQGGDIDNRIKTLWDGLSMPTEVQPGDIPRGENVHRSVGPPHDAPPMEVLLESDSLITGVSVTTDRLLTAPEATPSTVRLVIGVTVSVTRITDLNIGFIGD